LSREGSLSCHTCYNKGLGFSDIRRTIPFSRFLRKGVLRNYSITQYLTCPNSVASTTRKGMLMTYSYLHPYGSGNTIEYLSFLKVKIQLLNLMKMLSFSSARDPIFFCARIFHLHIYGDITIAG
jgi:hypothetical protein